MSEPTTRKLNILQVASHTRITRGGAVQLALLAGELARRGHKVTCVFHRKRAGEASDIQELSSLRELGVALELFDEESWSEIARFRRLVRGLRPDVIHSHRDLALRFSYLASWGLDIPVFVTQRGTTYRPPRWGWARWALHSRRLDRIVAVAEAVKRVLVEDEKLASEKVEVIYGGVDTQIFHPTVDGSAVRREWDPTGRRLTVGLIAALAPKKGHRYFFEAARRVLEEFPEALFLCIGEGSPSKFDAHLRELGLSERIRFLGHRGDMPACYAALDIVVCASTKGEGLTGTLREALAVARPVISTDVSGNREIVIPNETGLLVPPANSVAMAEAMLSLLRQPALGASLGKRGFELIAEKFDNRKRAEKIENLYTSILNRKAARTA